jgi:hypothetical protein
MSIDSTALAELGAFKSSHQVISKLTEVLKKDLLLEGEELTKSPISFTNIFLEYFGRMTSNSFYEQLMYKNELLPSTAIKLRSLINRLSSDEVTKIFAHPAAITIVLGFEKEALIQNAVVTGYGDKRLKLNKNTTFTLTNLPNFTIDHDLEIIITNYESESVNIYSKFDLSDKDTVTSGISNVNNPILNSQVIRYDNRNIYMMFLPIRQYERTEHIYPIVNDNPDIVVNYKDELFGFEVFIKEKGKIVWRYLKGQPDGVINTTGYNFALDNVKKKLGFNYNRNTLYFTPVIGDTVKIILYTTKGAAGNFKLPDIYENYKGLDIKLSQNRNDLYQDRLTDLQPFLSLNENESYNGRSMATLDEVKQIIINKGSINKTLTYGELETKAYENNLTIEKIRDDVRCIEYRLNGILKNVETNTIYSSNNLDLRINFNNTLNSEVLDPVPSEIDNIPIIREIEARMIDTKSVFLHDGETSVCQYQINPTSFADYYEDYMNNGLKQYCFPYFIKLITSKFLKTEIFNLNQDSSHILNFIFFDENTSYETNVLSLSIYRNTVYEPLSVLDEDGIVYTNKTKGYYILEFNVLTSKVVVDNLYNTDNPIVKFKIVIENSTNSSKFGIDCVIRSIDRDSNVLKVRGYILTDNGINSEDRLLVRDFSIYPIPISPIPVEFYFIDGNVNIQVISIQKDPLNRNITNESISYLTDLEVAENYFVSTVYKVENINIFNKLDNVLNLAVDYKIENATYKTLEYDVYGRYEQNVYQTNVDGSIKTEEREIVVNPQSGDTITVKVQLVVPGKEKGMIIYEKEVVENGNTTTVAVGGVIYTYIITEVNGITVLRITEEGLDAPTDFNLVSRPNDYLNLLNGGDPLLLGVWDDQNGTILEFTGVNYKQTTTYGDLTTDILEYRWSTNLEQTKLSLYDKDAKPQIKYAKGQFARDSFGDYVIDKPEQHVCILKNVPVYDRIYSLGNSFIQVNNAYSYITNKIKAISTIAPSGVTFTSGIRNTSGRGDWEIYNMISEGWGDIDNISISFDIGVKYDDTLSQAERLINNDLIVKYVTEYVNNFTGISFSAEIIFEYVKSLIPTINHLILNRINNYPANVTQMVRKKGGLLESKDILNIKHIIDADNSNIDEQKVSFKPDITVRII